MKSIGIITLTRDENYGNRLQNYAVQEVIRKLGFVGETLVNTTTHGFGGVDPLMSTRAKLRPGYLMLVLKTRINRFLMIKNDGEGIISSFVWKIRNRRKIPLAILRRKKAFAEFNERHINTSAATISLATIERTDIGGYEFFFCGSDQVWNPYYAQTSMIDFLSFAPEHKRVAYAPSFGVDHVPEGKAAAYRSWIAAIPHLSVREEKGAEIIRALTGREATVLVDPTLMLGAEEWLRIEKKPDFHHGDKFILTYILGNRTRAYQNAINTMAAEKSCRIINLADIRYPEFYAADPGEFVYLIKHAALICTDSFHGVVLSLILRTPFVVFERVEGGHSMNSRLETLLSKFNMRNRIYCPSMRNLDAFDLDFSGVGSVIAVEQEKAWRFLKEAIAGIACGETVVESGASTADDDHEPVIVEEIDGQGEEVHIAEVDT